MTITKFRHWHLRRGLRFGIHTRRAAMNRVATPYESFQWDQVVKINPSNWRFKSSQRHQHYAGQNYTNFARRRNCASHIPYTKYLECLPL